MELQYANVDDLKLDYKNPRLGRNSAAAHLNQDEILDRMRAWNLEELAQSFLESGFWAQEALIVVREQFEGEESLIVIEGNRRLATLKQIKKCQENPVLAKGLWQETLGLSKDILEKIPYILVESRDEVAAYLGFRHVTGIQQWNPTEKAEYIAWLIESKNSDYKTIAKKIGSKAPSVRQHYIAYKLLLQMEDLEGIEVSNVEKRFSVLYLSIRSSGVQKYLGLNLEQLPAQHLTPVPESHTDNLVNYAKWLFGDLNEKPIISDSRDVDDFGRVLGNDEAVKYLESSIFPDFEQAKRYAGFEDEDIILHLSRAADNVQIVLNTIHLHKQNTKIIDKVGLLKKHIEALDKILS